MSTLKTARGNPLIICPACLRDVAVIGGKLTRHKVHPYNARARSRLTWCPGSGRKRENNGVSV